MFALAFTTVLTGCRWLERSQTCPPIGAVTRMVVTQGTSQDHVFTEPERLRPLIAFANARRKSSQPWDTMPAPQITAMLYDNADYVCPIGAGSNFLFVSCPGWRGIRTATDAELQEFKYLVGEAN
jgi:hypothetical protein